MLYRDSLTGFLLVFGETKQYFFCYSRLQVNPRSQNKNLICNSLSNAFFYGNGVNRLNLKFKFNYEFYQPRKNPYCPKA